MMEGSRFKETVLHEEKPINSPISNDGAANATERVLERMAKSSSNEDFLANLNRDA